MQGRILLFLTFGVLFLLPRAIFAEGDPAALPSVDGISKIKGEINTLMAENKKLEWENTFLKNEMDYMNNKIGQEKDTVAGLEKIKERARRPQKLWVENLKEPASSLREDKAKMEHESALRKDQKDHTAVEITALQEKLRLLWLKASDLEYQKRELQADIELKNFVNEETRRKEQLKSNTAKLKEALERYKNKEQELDVRLGKIDTKSNLYPGRIENLQAEVQEFEQQMKTWQRKLDYQMKENAHLKNKRLYLTKLMEANVWEKEEEKSALKDTLQEKEMSYYSLNNQLDKSLSYQNQKKRLLKEIIAMDKENQDLRTKIERLEGTISK